jgi:hypothetical protein
MTSHTDVGILYRNDVIWFRSKWYIFVIHNNRPCDLPTLFTMREVVGMNLPIHAYDSHALPWAFAYLFEVGSHTLNRCAQFRSQILVAFFAFREWYPLLWFYYYYKKYVKEKLQSRAIKSIKNKSGQPNNKLQNNQNKQFFF